MTLRDLFIAALRKAGAAATTKQIHQAHKAAGGRYSIQAFVTCAWELTKDKTILRTNTRPPYIYALPRKNRGEGRGTRGEG